MKQNWVVNFEYWNYQDPVKKAKYVLFNVMLLGRITFYSETLAFKSSSLLVNIEFLMGEIKRLFGSNLWVLKD
jgi:hypothetical protein